MSVKADSILYRNISWNPASARSDPDVSSLPAYPGPRQLPPTPSSDVEVPEDLGERSIQPFSVGLGNGLSTRTLAPSSSSSVSVVIPQSSQARGSTFVRAMPTPSPIPPEQFLLFLDALNIAMAASPPMKVLELAGDVLGFIPVHPLDLVSLGVSLGAHVGNEVIKKVRGDYVIRKANAEVFAPNGYKVEVCSREAMLKIVGGGAMVEERSALVKMDEESGRLVVDERHYIERAIGGLMGKGLIRRLEFLGLPPPDKKVLNVIDQVSAFQVARKQREEERSEQKRSSKRADLVQTHSFLSGRSSSSGTSSASESAGKKQMKAMKKMEKVGSKMERKRAKYDVKVSELESELMLAQSRGDQKSVYKLQSKLAKVNIKASGKLAKAEAKADRKGDKTVRKVERKLGKLERREERVMKGGLFLVITELGNATVPARGGLDLDESGDSLSDVEGSDSESEDGFEEIEDVKHGHGH